MSYTRGFDFTTRTRWPASSFRTELEAFRDEVNGGLASGDLSDGALGLNNLAQPRTLGLISLNGNMEQIGTLPGYITDDDALPVDEPSGARVLTLGCARVSRDIIVRAASLRSQYTGRGGIAGVAPPGTNLLSYAEKVTALALDLLVFSGTDTQYADLTTDLVTAARFRRMSSLLTQEIDIYEGAMAEVAAGALYASETVSTHCQIRTLPGIIPGVIPANSWIFLVAKLTSSAASASSETSRIRFDIASAALTVEHYHQTLTSSLP